MPGGYQRYPQRPAPNSQQVGGALMQQQAGGMAPAPQPTGPGQMASGPESYGPGQMEPAMGDAPEAALRSEGARRMTGAGQINDQPAESDGHSANALNVAVGEALTRLGGGYGTNENPYKDREAHMRQLQQLGMSEMEAALMVRTGGV